MREATYIDEFPQDRTEDRITAFIKIGSVVAESRKLLEHHRERREGNVAFIGVQQIGVGVADQSADHEDRADVEQQDAPEHGPDRLWNALAWVTGLCRGQTHAFSSLEGKSGDQEHCQHRHRASDKRRVRAGLRVAQRPVVKADVLIADHAGDHQCADSEKYDYRDHFDAGEPVFGLRIGFDGQQIQRQQQHEKTCRPERRNWNAETRTAR
jgi:hypothetical protein